MKVKLLPLFFLIFSVTVAQTTQHPVFPQKEINQALNEAYVNSLHPQNFVKSSGRMNNNSTSVFPLIKNLINLKNPSARMADNGDTFQSIDTVIVGAVPHDTLRITGTYFNNGPIIVANDGVLIFHNADATIIGNLYLLGLGKILGDSSSLSFPQQYFYQRSLIATGNSYVRLETCSLSYGGMSHNLIATDTSTVELINIYNGDWTTAGTYGIATVILNGSNLAGEYIMNGNATASFTNVNTLLLWHQLPETAVINFSFPNGDTLNHYVFNNTVNGINGIGYSATIDTSWNVWWGMMPVNGSDVTISNSKIRAIGAWFENGDSASASGLVDNSTYSDFVAPLTDRNLHLINSTVQTWSLYVFDTSKLNISGCILGEVGSQGTSTIQSSSFFLDGSGGYFWATDTSITIASSVAATANVRSEHNGFFIFGYSTMTSGVASSIDNSLLIVAQSGVPQDPIPYDGAIAWYQNISQPSTAYTNAMVPISGSEWIDQGPNGSWMDYGNYSLYYQTQGGNTWTQLVKDSVLKIHNGTLGIWNTNGLASGNYTLQLLVKNNLGDSVQAFKSVTLLPAVLGIDEGGNNNALSVYPNPAGKELVIDNAEDIERVEIYSMLGERVASPPTPLQKRGVDAIIGISELPSGIYMIVAETQSTRHMGKFIKE